jgi:hypothetical protein
MTGFTSLQVNTERRTIQKIDVPASIVAALEEHGHTVDWRRCTPGEDLSSYDVMWCNLAPLNSLNGRAGAMGALWALSSGLPTVGFFDDWQFSTVFNGARALIRKPEMLYKYMLVGAAHRGEEGATYFDHQLAQDAYDRIVAKNPEFAKKCYIERYFMYDTDENVKPHEARLLATAGSMLKDRWVAGMVPVCPMYQWGDRSKVRKRMPEGLGSIEALDPSPTIYGTLAAHTQLPAEEKKQSWILGALMPHDAWIDKKPVKWPVEFLGSRKMIRSRGGERVKTESEVIDRYNHHWGILSPPYPHAGCGWWRSRFIYAARVGSILVCDKGEGDPLGDAYKLRIPAVEQMTLDDLAAAAAAQQAALRPWMSAPETFTYHVNAIVDRAVREDKGWTVG